MLEATLKVNSDQPYKVVELIKDVVGELNGKKIAVLGLAFKLGTDGMRDAPSIKIVKALLNDGSYVYVYDLKALDNARNIFGDRVIYAQNSQEALSNADACIMVTECCEKQ